MDTLPEPRFLFDDVISVICSARGGLAAEPAGCGGSTGQLPLGRYRRRRPRANSVRRGGENAAELAELPAPSLPAPPGAGGALGRRPPPSYVGKLETSPRVSSLRTAHAKLLWICSSPVYLVTTLSNMT